MGKNVQELNNRITKLNRIDVNKILQLSNATVSIHIIKLEKGENSPNNVKGRK